MRIIPAAVLAAWIPVAALSSCAERSAAQHGQPLWVPPLSDYYAPPYLFRGVAPPRKQHRKVWMPPPSIADAHPAEPAAPSPSRQVAVKSLIGRAPTDAKAALGTPTREIAGAGKMTLVYRRPGCDLSLHFYLSPRDERWRLIERSGAETCQTGSGN